METEEFENEKFEKLIKSANDTMMQLHQIILEFHKEIERLRLELSGYRQAILQDKEMLGLKQEIDRLHSIIKEVKEYCKNKIQEQKDMKDFSKYYLESYDKAIKETHSTHSGVLLETIKSTTIKRYESVLEILDKENI